MLSITSSPSLAWPSAPAVNVAPVSAATAVTPVQSSARDAQAGLGRGREQPPPESLRRGSAEAGQERVALEAAPILPNESPDSPDGQASPELDEAQAKAQRQKAEEKASEKALTLQLQDVLSNVWKASAAVIDVVLGREAAMAEAQAGQPSEAVSAVAGDVSFVPASASAGASALPVVDAGSRSQPAALEARSAQDVVAYDAHGNSSWAPLESGSLISQRV